MTRHSDAETLARYREGDLRPWQSWRIRAHLARCAQCRELSSELAEVTSLLASVPQPPMPDDLLDRIQGVLAQEAASRASATATAAEAAATTGGRVATGPATAQARKPVVTEPAGTGGRGASAPRYRRPWRPRLPGWPGFRFGSPVTLRAAAAATALIVVGVGSYEVVQHAEGSSGPSAGAAPQAAPAHSAPRGPGYGPALHYRHSGQSDSITPITTNTDFVASQLGSQVSRLTGHGLTPSPAAGGSSSAGPNRALNSSPAPGNSASTFAGIPMVGISDCVNRIAAGDLVLLVDIAEFQGTRAVVIVTETAPASLRQIWVVGTGCSASRSDILDHAVLAAGS